MCVELAPKGEAHMRVCLQCDVVEITCKIVLGAALHPLEFPLLLRLCLSAWIWHLRVQYDGESDTKREESISSWCYLTPHFIKTLLDQTRTYREINAFILKLSLALKKCLLWAVMSSIAVLQLQGSVLWPASRSLSKKYTLSPSNKSAFQWLHISWMKYTSLTLTLSKHINPLRITRFIDTSLKTTCPK